MRVLRSGHLSPLLTQAQDFGEQLAGVGHARRNRFASRVVPKNRRNQRLCQVRACPTSPPRRSNARCRTVRTLLLGLPSFLNRFGQLAKLNLDKQPKTSSLLPKIVEEGPFATSAAATISSTVVAASPVRQRASAPHDRFVSRVSAFLRS